MFLTQAVLQHRVMLQGTHDPNHSGTVFIHEPHHTMVPWWCLHLFAYKPFHDTVPWRHGHTFPHASHTVGVYLGTVGIHVHMGAAPRTVLHGHEYTCYTQDVSQSHATEEWACMFTHLSLT